MGFGPGSLRCVVVAFGLAAAPLFAHAADPNKVLRFAFQLAESAFDPAVYQDQYSAMVVDQILEPMLRYEYLARPPKLAPTAAILSSMTSGRVSR